MSYSRAYACIKRREGGEILNSKALVILMLLSMLLIHLPINTAKATVPSMWASNVEDYHQGLRKDGSPVLPERSNPNNALGLPDSGVAGPPVKFFSLGFGGWIILGFPHIIANGPGNDVLVIETTWGSYPLEKADVYVSQDGIIWILAGSVDNVNKQGMVLLPPALAWVNFVKIVDTTNPALFGADGDGYDLDAVGAYYYYEAVPVYVDIKPGSWPNPINIGSRGVFAVAICGTTDFDVTTIVPESVRIYIEGIEEGVPPLCWSYEDVATPYTGEPSGGHALGGDGYLDLVFHFDTRAVVTTLGLAGHVGETIPLFIKGNFYMCFTPFMGQDYVRVQAPRRGLVPIPE